MGCGRGSGGLRELPLRVLDVAGHDRRHDGAGGVSVVAGAESGCGGWRARRWHRAGARPLASVTPFSGGYMLAWVGSAPSRRRSTSRSSPWRSPCRGWHTHSLATALILTGAFQLTRLKEACLAHCRSPAGFLYRIGGPVRPATPGLASSTGCTASCCWALMPWRCGGDGKPGVDGAAHGGDGGRDPLPFGARLARPIGVALIVAGVATFFA